MKGKYRIRNEGEFNKALAEINAMEPGSVALGSAKAKRLAEKHKEISRFARTVIGAELDQAEARVVELKDRIDETLAAAVSDPGAAAEEDFLIMALYTYFKASRNMLGCLETEARVAGMLRP